MCEGGRVSPGRGPPFGFGSTSAGAQLGQGATRAPTHPLWLQLPSSPANRPAADHKIPVIGSFASRNVVVVVLIGLTSVWLCFLCLFAQRSP